MVSAVDSQFRDMISSKKDFNHILIEFSELGGEKKSWELASPFVYPSQKIVLHIIINSYAST